MALDIVDLRTFYAGPLGQVVQRVIGRIVFQRWANVAGLSMLCIGHGTPYLESFRPDALRALAFMPAEQGVVHWPEDGRPAAALVDVEALPLPDASIDRVLVIHALEDVRQPGELLSEIWRILTPGGRVIVVVPRRRGVWARLDTTPFGQGQPFSRRQLVALMRDCLFSPVFSCEALYVPPFARPMLLRAAPAFETIGHRLTLPGAGVHVLEATKQLYRPVAVRRVARRALPQIRPALLPSPRRHI